MIMMKRFLLGLTVLLAVTTLSACQEEPVDELIISESSVTLDEGESYQLSFTSSFRDDHLTWVSSSNDLLTVVNGRLSAKEAGNVTVTVYARNGQIFDQMNVTIEDVPEPEIVPIEITVTGEGITSESPFNVSGLTITLNDEAGELIEAFEIEKGSLLSAVDFPETPDTFVGYFEDASVCGDEPYDLETEVNEALTLIQVTNNDSSPCITLDSVKISGSAVLGETLSVRVIPRDAEVSISWTADGEVLGTGPALTIDETLEGLEIDVNVSGVNDYTGTLTASTGLVEAKTYDVDVINEAGDTLTTLSVKAGDTIDQSLLPELGENEMGFYGTAESCDTPFDLDEPIEASRTLYVFTLDDQLPCAELELLTITGEAKVGETLIANIFPRGADVRFEWFVSNNNIAYSLIPGVTSAALVVNEDLEGKYIAVNVIGEGSYQGVLKNGTSRVAPKIETLENDDSETENLSEEEQAQIERDERSRELISQGYIPIATHEDLNSITTTTERTFATGTAFSGDYSGGAEQKYVIVNDIYLTEIHSPIISLGGILDGNNHTINDLVIDASSYNWGLFKFGINATIINLHFDNVSNISGTSQYGGTLFGGDEGSNITVSNVHVRNLNFLDIDGNVGGLIGYAEKITIFNSSVEGRLDGLNGVGGLIGKSELNISIDKCYFEGTIDAGQFAGGLLGWQIGDSSVETTIKESFVNAHIKGSARIGGFAGTINKVRFTAVNSYMIGSISTTLTNTTAPILGGIIGDFTSTETVSLENILFVGEIIPNVNDLVDPFTKDDNDISTTSAIYFHEIISDSGIVQAEVISNSKIETYNELISLNTYQSWDIEEYNGENVSTWVIGYEDDNGNPIDTMPWLSWQNHPPIIH